MVAAPPCDASFPRRAWSNPLVNPPINPQLRRTVLQQLESLRDAGVVNLPCARAVRPEVPTVSAEPAGPAIAPAVRRRAPLRRRARTSESRRCNG